MTCQVRDILTQTSLSYLVFWSIVSSILPALRKSKTVNVAMKQKLEGKILIESLGMFPLRSATGGNDVI